MEEIGSTVADRALAVATALSAEVVVLRDRLETIERLAARRGLFTTGEIDKFVPTPDEARDLKARRHGFIQRVFGALRDR